MDHTYCIVTVAKTFPKRRNTYASRIEKLRAANSKDLSITESLMVEAGAWLKVVIKDEDEEEEICCTVGSEEEEEEAGAEEERPDCCSPPPSGRVAQSPARPAEDGEAISEKVEKRPDDSPSSESPRSPPSRPRLEKPTNTEEEEEEEEEEESDEAYLERAAVRIREFQMQLKKARSFSVETLRDSAADIQHHTGLPDYSSFLALYDFLRPKGSGQMQYWGSVFKGRQRSGGNELGRHRKLSPMDELFLTLIRLRRGSPRKELAARFGVSESVVTRVFVTWCNVMYERFQQLPVVWAGEAEPEEEGRPTQGGGARGLRQHAVKTVPAAVKEAYLQAAAYLARSDFPVGAATRPLDKPFNDDLMELLDPFSAGERDEETEDELGRPEQSNRDVDENSVTDVGFSPPALEPDITVKAGKKTKQTIIA